MARFVIRRIALGPLLVATVTFMIFVRISLPPGDPAQPLSGDNPSQIEYVRESLHLDDPLVVRYGRWVGDAVTGDLGNGYMTGHPAVGATLMQRAPIALSIAGFAIFLSLLGAIVIGTLAAVSEGSIVDRAITWLSAIL